MKKLFVILSFIPVLACSNGSSSSGGGEGHPPPAPPIANQKPGVGDILILGDSLAAGQGASHQGMIPSKCLSRVPHDQVSGLGVSGLTTQQLLDMVRDEEKAGSLGRPKLIFVSIAGNDAIQNHYRPGTYPAEKTYAQANELFDRLVKTNAMVVYLGLNPPFQGGERLKVVSDIAKKYGILVFDGMNGMWGRKDLMADQFHPNDQGYHLLCERLLQAIKAYYP